MQFGLVARESCKILIQQVVSGSAENATHCRGVTLHESANILLYIPGGMGFVARTFVYPSYIDLHY
jgi:hypothetical protein